MGVLLKGKHIAHHIETFCQSFLQKASLSPGLGILRIGHNPASIIYIERKRLSALRMGFYLEETALEETATPSSIIQQIQSWNQNPHIHGILIQLPLPFPHKAADYIQQIHPLKDVDGLRPCSPFTPCTPLGCLLLLKAYAIPLKSARCVVVGRSFLVGRPLALLLLDHDATVTIAHRHTQALPDVTRHADIVCAAIGQPGFITQDYLSSQATVIDIGIHKTAIGTIVGDVLPDVNVAFKTPVPGGVGPMTIACLMWNVVRATLLEKAPTQEDLIDSFHA